MLKSENVATPFTAFTVLVPDNVPGRSRPPLCPMAIVTGPLYPAIVLPAASTTLTSTGGVIVVKGSARCGWTLNARCCCAGLRTNVLASHVLGWVNSQPHCGSTERASVERK